MKFTILIPHFKSKITAYAIDQLLKNKGRHEIEIFVIDNNWGDGSAEYFSQFNDQIRYFKYPKDQLQSHGVAFDFVMPLVTNEYFITIESDSFPTNDKWLDYYEQKINEGYDCVGSLLKLSGGEYVHPCGALYKKSVWQEAKRYCNAVRFAYFPNMNYHTGFACHTMIHADIVEDVLKSPYDYLELADDYKGNTREQTLKRMMWYSPIVAPFHNGMGMTNESLKTYGQRNIESEVPQILLRDKPKIVNRIGYEPGQWLTYWQLAMGKKIFFAPTEITWMPNRENEQQERTVMENGFTHLWAGSSYLDMKDTDMNDVYEYKHNLIEQLYNSVTK